MTSIISILLIGTIFETLKCDAGTSRSFTPTTLTRSHIRSVGLSHASGAPGDNNSLADRSSDKEHGLSVAGINASDSEELEDISSSEEDIPVRNEDRDRNYSRFAV